MILTFAPAQAGLGCKCQNRTIRREGKARCSRNCPMRSSSCRSSCCAAPAAIARWPRSWRSCCSTTNKLCFARWNWHLRRASLPRPLLSKFWLNVLHRLTHGILTRKGEPRKTAAPGNRGSLFLGAALRQCRPFIGRSEIPERKRTTVIVWAATSCRCSAY